MDEVKEAILRVLRGVVREKSPEIETIAPDQALVEDLGLTSLDLARIIAKLELKLGVDPFSSLVPVTSIRTAGDLCAAYAKCFVEDDASAEAEDAAADAAVEPTSPRGKSGLDSQKSLRQKARREQSP
jgi:acyl carrier protein